MVLQSFRIAFSTVLEAARKNQAEVRTVRICKYIMKGGEFGDSKSSSLLKLS
jgi:hypothetical protein